MRTVKQHICFIIILLGLTGCIDTRTTDSPSQLVARIRNTDIHWDADYVGLVAKAQNASQAVLKQPPEHVVPSLMTALEDKNRYIAAHVLLTELVTTTRTYGEDSWNGLRVLLHADGSVTFPDGQQEILLQRWNKWRVEKGKGF